MNKLRPLIIGFAIIGIILIAYTFILINKPASFGWLIYGYHGQPYHDQGYYAPGGGGGNGTVSR